MSVPFIPSRLLEKIILTLDENRELNGEQSITLLEEKFELTASQAADAYSHWMTLRKIES